MPDRLGYRTAREANRNRNIPTGTVVLLTFMAYDVAGEPLYVFNYNAPLQEGGMPIHDHQDDVVGGFAFETYHPGTGPPQQPWHVWPRLCHVRLMNRAKWTHIPTAQIIRPAMRAAEVVCPQVPND